MVSRVKQEASGAGPTKYQMGKEVYACRFLPLFDLTHAKSELLNWAKLGEVCLKSIGNSSLTFSVNNLVNLV